MDFLQKEKKLFVIPPATQGPDPRPWGGACLIFKHRPESLVALGFAGYASLKALRDKGLR